MQLSQIPLRMQKAWGAAAGGAYIRTVPVASQIGIADGAASFTDGFVPDNFTPVAGGGVPPFGQDMNGALNVITSWEQWLQAGGAIGYDATFSTAIGGYPKGCILNSNVTPGAEWYSTVDNNTTNPDDPLTSANWARIGLVPGTPVPLLTAVAQPGFLTANGTTFGSASSGAASVSDAYLFIFKAVWDQFSNTQCPILDSSGSASTRGANAVADFIANKRLTMPNMKGLGLMGVDTMGGTASTFLSGVPVTSGNTATPGSILGENLHTLSTAEIASHYHTAAIYDPTHAHSYLQGSPTNVIQSSNSFPALTSNVGATTSGAATGVRVNSSNGLDTTNSTGGGGSHNTVERNMAVFWGLRI